MTYYLHRDSSPDASAPVGGEYPDFTAALHVRDDDVIAQLRRRPSPPRTFTHVIVGPGFAGPRTPHVVTTFAGVQHGAPDPAGEIAAIQRWLLEVHQP